MDEVLRMPCIGARFPHLYKVICNNPEITPEKADLFFGQKGYLEQIKIIVFEEGGQLLVRSKPLLQAERAFPRLVTKIENKRYYGTYIDGIMFHLREI